MNKVLKQTLATLILAIVFFMPVTSLSSIMAGHLVQTPTGPKTIESLKVGDQVVTYNETISELENQPVTFLYTRIADHLIKITATHADGHTTSIHITEEHAVYVGNKNLEGKIDYQWQKAQTLRIGNALLTHDKKPVYVIQIEKERVSQRVFNIEVAQQHNYFSGTRESVLVHNPNETKFLLSVEPECGTSELGYLDLSHSITSVERLRFPSYPKKLAVVIFNASEENYTTAISRQAYKQFGANNPYPVFDDLFSQNNGSEFNRSVIFDDVLAFLDQGCDAICLHGIDNSSDLARKASRRNWGESLSTTLASKNDKPVPLFFSIGSIDHLKFYDEYRYSYVLTGTELYINGHFINRDAADKYSLVINGLIKPLPTRVEPGTLWHWQSHNKAFKRSQPQLPNGYQTIRYLPRIDD